VRPTISPPDEIQLQGFRKDGARSETTISNSNFVRHTSRRIRKSKDIVPRQDIRIKKTFRVQVNRSESEQDLNIH
jgi:hypothetical protein